MEHRILVHTTKILFSHLRPQQFSILRDECQAPLLKLVGKPSRTAARYKENSVKHQNKIAGWKTKNAK